MIENTSQRFTLSHSSTLASGRVEQVQRFHQMSLYSPPLAANIERNKKTDEYVSAHALSQPGGLPG